MGTSCERLATLLRPVRQRCHTEQQWPHPRQRAEGRGQGAEGRRQRIDDATEGPPTDVNLDPLRCLTSLASVATVANR